MEKFFFTTELQHAPSENSPGVLTGYAMKFNVLSHDRGGFRDAFRPGVFGDSINATDPYDVQAYYNHNDQIYLGRTGNGSLKLATDSVGLKFSLELPDTQHGRDIAALISRKDLTSMSFGYLPEVYHWKTEDQGPIREHLQGRLAEISVVHQAAFPHTKVELNSLDTPSEDVLASLAMWQEEQKCTPRRDMAKRKIQLWKI